MDSAGRVSVEPIRPPPIGEVLVYAVSTCFLMVCAVVGICFRRRRLRDEGILWCVVLSVVAVSVIYVPVTRYRAPMESVLLFYAAVALATWIGEQPSTRARRRVVCSLA